MSGTDGPNTASTGSMSSTYVRVQAVPAVQKSEILGVLRVTRVLNPEILQHSSKILPSNTLTSSTSQYKNLKYCEYYCSSQYEILKYSSIESISSTCLLYTSPSPRDATLSRMPSSA